MQLTTDDLLQTAQTEERGMLDRKDKSSETRRQVAMAVVAVNFPDLKNIEFVRIGLCPGEDGSYQIQEGMLRANKHSVVFGIKERRRPDTICFEIYAESYIPLKWSALHIAT
ncbi:hypothetical protein F2Q68_00006488 [Brassica cretica]|uniref:Uncharacterized protein n=1 Tax=Brassica cretica TaxID=69181 RepID=A0A8S9JFA3_BRACR|nr:hypothetical protein F2Q68_00006488 [Brassica cretica]